MRVAAAAALAAALALPATASAATVRGLPLGGLALAGASPVWLEDAAAGEQLGRVPFSEPFSASVYPSSSALGGRYAAYGHTIAAWRHKQLDVALFGLDGRTRRVLAKGFASGAALSRTHVAWAATRRGSASIHEVHVVRR